MLIIENSDLVERYLLMNVPKDSQCLRTTKVKALYYHQDGLNFNSALKDFVVISKDDTAEDITN